MSGEPANGTDDRTDLLALTRTLASLQGEDGARLAPGTRFGRYILLSALGEGGMGAVYLAEQTEPVRRKVAIKLSRRRRVSAEELARFAVERQALAHMNHPAIAQVFDAGTLEDGTPYFVMEYVEGVRLTDFCASRGLDLAARIELMRRVCLGVAHAHQKGIIHCDLKPGNILATELDGQGQPKIIDFGIARALGAGGRDGSSGTPGYMSPEQARGAADIDTRTDVYSLGLLLWELVTTRPYRDLERLGALSMEAMRDALVTESLRPLPALPGLARARRRELDAILARALAPEPGQRYAGAAQLADELGRWQARLPVEAVGEGALYRLGCFVRRQALLSAAAAVFLLVTAGLLWKLASQLAETRRERDTAEQVTALMLETFSAADPYVYPGGSISVRELLQAAADRLRTRPLEPGVRVRVLEALGAVQARLELYGDAASTYAHASDQVTPKDASNPHWIALRLAAAEATMNGERFDAALADVERLTAEIRRRGRPAALIAGLLLKADILDYQGRTEQALALLAEASALLERHPDREQQHMLLRRRGRMAGELYRVHEGVADLERALALAEALWGEDDLRTLDALSDLAIVSARAGRLDESERHRRAVAERTERIWGGESVGLAVAFDNLAVLLQRMGGDERLAEAEALSRRALRIYASKGVERSMTAAITANNLASTLSALGQRDEAIEALRMALDVLSEILGPDHPRTAIVRHNLGRNLVMVGALEEAEQALQGSAEALRVAFGEQDPRLAIWRTTRAELLLRRGEPAAARDELRAAAPVLLAAFAEDSEEVGRLRDLQRRLVEAD
jgi:tetratricopeptide (TPR) repeat protein